METHMKDRKIFPINLVRICIDVYQNAEISGRLYSKMQAEEIVFHNCSELLLKVDRIFDENGFPQAFQQKRTFKDRSACKGYSGRPTENMSDETISEQSGETATFDLVVETRCRTGWQGVLWKSDTTEGGRFGSEMELLKIIFSELEEE